MKITKISLNCRRSSSVSGEQSDDFQLYFFRSPVIFDLGGAEVSSSGPAAMIYSGGRRQFFHTASGKQLHFDLVSFRMNSSDKQYIAALDLPIGQPVELKDSLVVLNTLKNMEARRSSPEFLELSMRLLFIELSGTSEGDSDEPDIPRYGQLKELREAIYDDPLLDWSVDRICAEMDVSRTYFHRIYQSAFGVTCRQDIIESRLLCAERLLEETDLPVSAVAEQCGYDSDSYFMRQFKQHRGCTPSEYRRRIYSDGKIFKKS